jgi:hypothetical protein
MKWIIILLVLMVMVPCVSGSVTTLKAIQINEASVSEISPGEVGEVWVELYNPDSSALYKNIEVALSSRTTEGRSYYREPTTYPVVPVGSSEYYIEKIFPRESKLIKFRIAANPDAAPGTYLMKLEVYYQTPRGDNTTSELIGVTVLPCPRPVIELSNVKVIPDYPEPGQVFTLSFDIENKKEAIVKDLIITMPQSTSEKKSSLFGLSSEEESSNPLIALGSSTRYLGDLALGEKKEVTYSLGIPEDMKTGPYTVKVVLSYIDQNDNEQTLSQEIGIQVVGKPKLSIHFLETESSSPSITTKIKVTNVGKGTARNVKISVINNEFFKPDRDAYVASVLGRDDTVDVEVNFISKVIEEGSYPLELRLTYLSNGEEVEEKLKEDVYLKKSSGLAGFVLLGAIIAIPAFVLVYIAKRRKGRIREE